VLEPVQVLELEPVLEPVRVLEQGPEQGPVWHKRQR
jgi:hypothetical protein